MGFSQVMNKKTSFPISQAYVQGIAKFSLKRFSNTSNVPRGVILVTKHVGIYIYQRR